MLIQEINGIDTGTAFIIDIDKFSNYNSSMTPKDIAKADEEGWINPMPPIYSSKQLRAVHIFKDKTVIFDHNPTSTETNTLSEAVVMELSAELHKINQTQPVMLKFNIPAEVSDTDAKPLEFLMPIFFRTGVLYTGGSTFPIIWGQRINLRDNVIIDNCSLTTYTHKANIIGTENYRVRVGCCFLLKIKAS